MKSIKLYIHKDAMPTFQSALPEIERRLVREFPGARISREGGKGGGKDAMAVIAGIVTLTTAMRPIIIGLFSAYFAKQGYAVKWTKDGLEVKRAAGKKPRRSNGTSTRKKTATS